MIVTCQSNESRENDEITILAIVYRRLVSRLGHGQAIGAIAHRLCRLIWKILHQRHSVRRLRVRQQAAPTGAIRVAWSAQHRLHARYRRLLAHGKSPQLAVTAVAREPSAFVWPALTQ